MVCGQTDHVIYPQEVKGIRSVNVAQKNCKVRAEQREYAIKSASVGRPSRGGDAQDFDIDEIESVRLPVREVGVCIRFGEVDEE
jgi:hypothetical protein